MAAQVCPIHPPPPDQHLWRVEGEFIDILAFLCEFVLNRQHGTEMLLHSQRMYESSEGVVFLFTSNWGLTEMTNAFNASCSHVGVVKAGMVYLGTPDNQVFTAM